MIRSLPVAAAVILLPLAAVADSYLPPRSKTFGSPSGACIVRIDPAGSSNEPKRAKCRALIFTFDEAAKEYVLTKELTLANPTRPAEAVISDDGRFLVTFDDYYGMGYGDNVVVIYDLLSGSETHFKLEDFLPARLIEEFSKSTTTRQWRGNVAMTIDQRTVYVAWATSFFDAKKLFPGFIVNLETKTVAADERGAAARAAQQRFEEKQKRDEEWRDQQEELKAAAKKSRWKFWQR